MRVLGWIFLVLSIAGVLGGGGLYIHGRYEGFVADAARSRARIAELEAEVASVGAERESVEKRFAAAQDELAVLRLQVADVAKQRAEADKRRAEQDVLAAGFQPMVEGKKLEISRRGDALVVKILAHELFGRGSADLSVPGKQTLTEVAEVLKKQWTGRIRIGGHTDDLPIGGEKFRSNWDLSSAYAATAAQFLVASGLDAKNLVASGYAEFEPVGDNKTAAGQQANRRIELVLVPPTVEAVAPAPAAVAP